MKLIAKVFLIASLIGVSACDSTHELKSPCVGAENSPCDRRAPANQA